MKLLSSGENTLCLHEQLALSHILQLFPQTPVPLGLDSLGKGVAQALLSSNNREEERLRVRDKLLVFCLLSDLGACMYACSKVSDSVRPHGL